MIATILYLWHIFQLNLHRSQMIALLALPTTVRQLSELPPAVYCHFYIQRIATRHPEI